MPQKIRLSHNTYVTKRGGKLVMVREKRHTGFDAGFDLAGEAFGGPSVPKQSSRASSTDSTPSDPGITSQHTHSIRQTSPSIMCEPQAEQKIQPESHQDTMSYPAPSFYQSGGDRHLALLPVGPHGQPIFPQQGCIPYHPMYMYPQGLNMSPWGRLTFPSMGVDPSQFSSQKIVPPGEAVAAQIPATMHYHICTNCKRPRSRRYQSEHPLKPGEVPPISFCRKCQKDATSTEQSDDTEEDSRKKKKKGDKKKRQSKDVKGKRKDREASPKSINNDWQKDMLKEYSDNRGRCGYSTLRINIHNDTTNSEKQEPLSPLIERTKRGTKSSDMKSGHNYSSGRGNGRSPTRIIINEFPHPQDSLRSDHSLRLAQSSAAMRETTESQGGAGRRSRHTIGGYREPRHSRATMENFGNWHPQLGQERDHEEKDLSMSATGQKSSRRRPRDRTFEGGECNWTGHPWHRDDCPQKDDEIFAVAERYVYHPRHHSPISDQQRHEIRSRQGTRQQGIDEVAPGSDTHYQQSARETNVINYFQCACRRDGSGQGCELCLFDSTRNNLNDSPTMSRAPRLNREYLGNEGPYPPQAPSPPRVHIRDRELELDTWVEPAPTSPPHPLDDNEMSIRLMELQLPSEENARHSRNRLRSVESREQGRRGPIYRPLYERMRTRGRAERATHPTSRSPWERYRPVPDSISESTEEGRRLTYQEPEADVDDNW